MKMLVQYFRQRKRALILFVLCVFILAAVFFLYNLPLEPVIYGAMICMIPAVLVFAADMKRIRRKHIRLMKISSLPASLMENMPEICSLDDEDYQRIISSLREEENRLRTDMTMRYQNMTDYYTIWAHQIKTPIASMRLTLQNEDSPLSRQLFEELQRIEQYVEMVLVFLRLDSDSSDFVFRSQPLDPILKDEIKRFAPQFIRKKIKLCYEPMEVTVLTDEKWLGFVIGQILSNSLKYMDKGTITITVEDPLTLCIKDTGIGIAAEDLPRIFEKSFTGCNGRADKKASGLGLYLCRQICNRLGHTISVSSVPGKGTVVRINLERDKMQFE